MTSTTPGLTRSAAGQSNGPGRLSYPRTPLPAIAIGTAEIHPVINRNPRRE